ncbi:MAG: radical SAM protein [Candidatus Hadarchaeales archaeon]
MGYQRFLTPASKPFDPIELARETERMVTRKGEEGLERKYTDFYSVPVYRGIATGYAVGCCLRCFYCWSDWSRDFPERYGQFYSPRQVAERLFQAAERGVGGRWRGLIPKVQKLRLSGCEPTLGKEHLLEVLRLVHRSKYLFILETNGMLLGTDRAYVRRLAEFKDKLYVRVSFKAATPEGFTFRTGAVGSFWELPFKALRFLLDEGVYARAAAMTDPAVMPAQEREVLISRLEEIDPAGDYRRTLEEERVDPYDTTLKRLKAYSDPEFAKLLERELSHDR